jgi:endonuclease/exonuclease/phosphatase family metal-dependent hydrolase
MVNFAKNMSFPSVSFFTAFLLFGTFSCSGQRSATPDSAKLLKVGFWNMENLFDTRNDAWNDDDFTPEGQYLWDENRYQQKLKNMARVLDSIQADIFGMCEVENKRVLLDLRATLVSTTGKQYEIVHFDSPDERGIDAAIYYHKEKLNLITASTVPVVLPNNQKTRDILHAVFYHTASGDTLHYFVNHWPSRRGGMEGSAGKRALAAEALRRELQSQNLWNKAFIIVGDFNDNPWDSSISKVLGACKPAVKSDCRIHNLSGFHDVTQTGTLKYNNKWDIFDQIMIGSALWNKASATLKFKPYSNQIFAPEWILQHGGKYEGHPLRTFGGKTWLNGYSDHLPVTAELIYGK